ncbi:hypothetical protein ACVOZ6_004703 [Escherichia coli]
MKFSSGAFNAHIANLGQDVYWMRSWACPCMNPTSGSPKPSCPLCGGCGRIWDAPVEMIVGIARQSTQIKWSKMGQWEHGDMVVVLPENCEAWEYGGQYDRFITKNGLDGFNEVLVRGAATEKLRVPVNQINRCFWISPDDQTQLVEGGIPQVDDKGRLTWPDGGAPPLGQQYSVSGDRYSEYFLVDAYPDDRNEHAGMRLPKRVVLRKWDLFGRAART